MSDAAADHMIRDFPRPLLGFAAWSGTGKTTLLAQLLPLLKQSGLRIAVVKHAHHDFDIDVPGKDSHRLRSAGADEVLVAGRCRVAWIRECGEADHEPTLAEMLALLHPQRLDLVLIEGFKAAPFPKIELHRVELGKPLIYPDDPNVIAIASNGLPPLQLPSGLSHLPLDDVQAVADFVLDHHRLRQPLARRVPA